MPDARRAAAWDAHEREQRLAWLRLTPRQRLDWLWQARLFALRVEEARRRASAAEPPSPAGERGEPG